MNKEGLGQLVFGFQKRPGFDLKYILMGLMVDKVALGLVFSQVLRFPLLHFSFHQLVHIH
jgi:hypothetical protein